MIDHGKKGTGDPPCIYAMECSFQEQIEAQS